MMKLLSKIVWSEGMYLAPHHFQAQTRYFEDSIHFAVSNLWPHSYGFADIQHEQMGESFSAGIGEIDAVFAAAQAHLQGSPKRADAAIEQELFVFRCRAGFRRRCFA